MLRGDGRIIAGPWLGEVGWEVLYWIPLLRWCVSRWPELSERLVIVSRGGVAAWYEGVADTYVDVFEAFDENAFAHRLTEERRARRARGGRGSKQDEQTDWELEIGAWVSEKLGEPALPMLHPSILYRSKRLVLELSEADAAFTQWTRPDRGVLQEALPERYVAVRFYESDIFKGKSARSFAESATRALAERIPVVLLNPEMNIDHQHADFSSGSDAISLTPHISFENNLAIQSTAIANATAFVGTFGGLSFVSPHYGVPSVSFWSIANGGAGKNPKGMWRHLDLATRVFNRPGWGQLTARWCGDAPVEELVEPALTG